MRRRRLAVIALLVVLFLAISALLARVFSADGAERTAITQLVSAEAHGDAAAMIAQLEGCGRSTVCRTRAASLSRALARRGSVAILQLAPSSGFSLGGGVGVARVAWRAGSSLPVVQCVRVRRAGNALSGLTIELLAVSLRIKNDADCPARF